MKTTNYISTKKTGAGQFEVNVYETDKNNRNYFLGSFETNDSTLVDDISELENGYEKELMNFDTFEELVTFCKSKI